jgi:hypothetical protein
MENEKRLPEDEQLEMVAVAGPSEAQMIEELLRNNGIDCALQGNVVAAPWPTLSDLDEVRIFVQKKDEVRAKELVDAFFTPVGKDELEEGAAELGADDPDEPSGLKI